MTFKLNIDCDNEAFTGEQKHAEVARILREIADTVEKYHGLTGFSVHDINGNNVGKAVFK